MRYGIAVDSPDHDYREAKRLEALRRYDILDSPPDGNFDGITSLAARLLKVPVALTSLVDVDRIWFKSRHGLQVEQLGRDPGLCASAILEGEPYVVEDALSDPRTLDNPLVTGDFGLRFYAAVPLRTHDNHRLGTLCVLDTKPRKLKPEELGILETLAELVMDQMELRLASRRIAEKNAELAELNEEKDGFMAMAAHDLRNPLGTVMLYAKLLEEQEVGALNTEQADMISTMCEASEVMLCLINDYLEFFAVEKGRLQLETIRCDLNEVVEGCLKFHQIQARCKSMELAFEPASEPVMMELEPARIQQALGNLIGNAIKFSPTGSRICVRVRRDATLAWVEVSDAGPGVSGEDRARLFKPFSAASAVPTGGEKSTGLGLSIARRLMEAHGGSVEVASEMGMGSTFSLRLPLGAGVNNGRDFT